MLIDFALKVILQLIALFVKDAKKREEWENEIRAQAIKYNREVMTSAEIREREADTRKRLMERFKGNKPK